MNFSKLFMIAAAMATASAAPVTPSPRGISGGVQIINNLAQDVYLWSVSNVSGPMLVLPASGGVYAENWQINPNGGGVSIKLGCATDGVSVLQFEYTKSGEVLFWDLSSINLAKDSPLIDAGFAVTIDDASCATATCPPGNVNCAESYQFPDDHNTRACSAGAAYTLTLG